MIDETMYVLVAVTRQDPPAPSPAVWERTPASGAKETDDITAVPDNAPPPEAASPDGQEEQEAESAPSADEQKPSITPDGITVCLCAVFIFGLFLHSVLS